jgi:hypothetical protein
MADSSQHFLYGQHSTVAVSPLKAKTSAKLLDVLIETGRKGSNPIVQNVGSPLTKTIRSEHWAPVNPPRTLRIVFMRGEQVFNQQAVRIHVMILVREYYSSQL